MLFVCVVCQCVEASYVAIGPPKVLEPLLNVASVPTYLEPHIVILSAERRISRMPGIALGYQRLIGSMRGLASSNQSTHPFLSTCSHVSQTTLSSTEYLRKIGQIPVGRGGIPPPPDRTARTGQVSRSSIDEQLSLERIFAKVVQEHQPKFSEPVQTEDFLDDCPG